MPPLTTLMLHYFDSLQKAGKCHLTALIIVEGLSVTQSPEAKAEMPAHALADSAPATRTEKHLLLHVLSLPEEE